MKTKNQRIALVVVRSAWQADVLMRHFGATHTLEFQVFSTGYACLPVLKAPTSEVALLVLIAGLPGTQALVEQARLLNPSLPILLIVQSPADEAVAPTLLAVGATEKLPFGAQAADRLWALATGERQQPVNGCRKPQVPHVLLGFSQPMQRVFQLIQKAGAVDITVSLCGETGTGKEEVARAIHRASLRADEPFVALNMGAIPRELLESELFGHEKGAFTGAVSQRIGLIEQANGGTLFLDEIAELELALQVKLLRVIQERVLVRVGGKQLIPFDVRLIVASHTDLAQYVRTGAFREDLYYRLLGLPISLPPLRERGEDILMLAYHFLAELGTKAGRPSRFSPEAEQKLLQYAYPGNVRELRAMVELAVVLADGEQIEAADLMLAGSVTQQALTAVPGFDLTLREHTVRIIQAYLDHYHGNVLLAASRLGVGKSTIYRMLKNGEIKFRDGDNKGAF